MPVYTSTGQLISEQDPNYEIYKGQNNPSPTIISSDNLKPVEQINLLKQQEDTTNYQGIINAGLTAAEQNSGAQPEQTTTTSSLYDEWYKNFLTADNAPASLEGAYAGAYEQSGLEAKEQEVLEKQKTVQSAQTELNLLNAQMRALNAETQGAPIQMQEEAKGRGITAGGLAPLQAGELRKIALRSLPLEGQILAAQAKVASAQGDVQNAQNILNLAQEKFDRVFELKSRDIENQYNYKREQQKITRDHLTKKEQERLDKIQKEDKRKYQESQDNLKFAQKLSVNAMNLGLADVAGKLTQLDPSSPSFTADVAILQAKMVQKQEENKLLKEGWKYVETPKKRDDLIKQGYEITQAGGRTYARAGTMAISENPAVAAYAQQIQAGRMKLSSVPAELRDEVAIALGEFVPTATDGANIQAPAEQTKSQWTQQKANQIYNQYVEGGYKQDEAVQRVWELTGYKVSPPKTTQTTEIKNTFDIQTFYDSL